MEQSFRLVLDHYEGRNTPPKPQPHVDDPCEKPLSTDKEALRFEYKEIRQGFTPISRTHLKRPIMAQGGVSFRNDESIQQSSNEKRWRWPTIRV